MLRISTFTLLATIALAAIACSGNSNAPSGNSNSSVSLSAVRAWTGTLDITAQQSGSGSSGFAGFLIDENYRHDTTAHLAVSLTRDPAGSGFWSGTGQGNAHVQNQNVMTMTAPVAGVVCTGTLLWIGNEPAFSTTARLEAGSGNSVRLYLGRHTIQAPDAGNVVCPMTSATFPTTDPNSPIAPIEILSGLSMTPSFGNGNLFGAVTILGDSGIGGFVAGPARIGYLTTLNLNALP